jgi:hypothetical protein
MNNYTWKEVSKEFRQFAKFVASVLIDSVFLVIWVLVQWLSQKTIASLSLSEVDRRVRDIFQVLFAISTLAPVAIYIYADIRVMWIRARIRIQSEEAHAHKNKPSHRTSTHD